MLIDTDKLQTALIDAQHEVEDFLLKWIEEQHPDIRLTSDAYKKSVIEADLSKFQRDLCKAYRTGFEKDGESALLKTLATMSIKVVIAKLDPTNDPLPPEFQ